MGLGFSIKHANIVAYLTQKKSSDLPEPRIKLLDLENFCRILKNVAKRDRQPDFGQFLISKNSDWKNNIGRQADIVLEKLPKYKTYKYLENVPDPKHLLKNLKDAFEPFKLICLIIANQNDVEKTEFDLNSFFREVAVVSKDTLFLLPGDLENSKEGFSILDPFPQISKVAEQPDRLPGILFWTNTGRTLLSPLNVAISLLEELKSTVRWSEEKINNFLDNLENQISGSSPVPSKKLLHLSDLHFGKRITLKNQGYLLSHLHEVVPKTDRIVITGDLFDSPLKKYKQLFSNFYQELQRHSGKKPIVIPGNHDRRVMGIHKVKTFLETIIDLEWSKLIIDHDLKCVFFSLDSSISGSWARGNVSSDQMRDLATLYKNAEINNPEIKNYLRISLIHHHPFPFTEDEEPVSKKGKFNFYTLASWLGYPEEWFLTLKNSREYLQWCADRNISLVLHGHKHLQRHVTQEIRSKEKGEYCEINAIGCGTSLGVGNYPLSYNLINWDEKSRKWTAAFYADSNYGGFTPQKLTIKQIDSVK